MSKYRKAVVAVVGAAVDVLAVVSVDVPPAVSSAAVGLAIAIIVLIVPNEQ